MASYLMQVNRQAGYSIGSGIINAVEVDSDGVVLASSGVVDAFGALGGNIFGLPFLQDSTQKDDSPLTPVYAENRAKVANFAGDRNLGIAGNLIGHYFKLHTYGSELTITNTVKSSGVVTITTGAPHGLIVGQSVLIAAVTTPTVYNTVALVTSAPTTTTFTYSYGSDTQGTAANTGSVTPAFYLSTWRLLTADTQWKVARYIPIKKRVSSTAANYVKVVYWMARTMKNYADTVNPNAAKIIPFEFVGESLATAPTDLIGGQVCKVMYVNDVQTYATETFELQLEATST